eukprot:TRINITY_DN43213_c0_g1_i1.p1 TRINITY_DN43213_c0_g1~~TRINITY_DN43213_c0_g1_i1.p1  ORF type:complete len:963 (+),score=203.12 TRINITY_DN43213_c0_g1_i1:138-3026(+)
MSQLSNTFLPPARQLHRESQLVQEHIRKTQLKQDFEKSVKEKLQTKHSQRRQKILIVANRLPSSCKWDPETNSYVFTRNSGGLVSCLTGLTKTAGPKFDMVWIGWAGTDVSPEHQTAVTDQAMRQNCYPVFLSSELISEYYNGFANNVLWPLFHYIMPPFDKGVNECSTSQWEAYKKANEIFTEAILQVYEDDDYVWVHDYHLMLVPKMLRDQKPDSNIGWFLHTPFPSAEIYRTLPWRQEIIGSLLHANLLGFHVYDYLRHFLSSCVQLTSLEISQHTVDATSIGGCVVTCATVPIGISVDDFTEALQKDEVKQQVEKLREQYGGRRVILGIDRLDYMKGIPHKLRAFGCFLDRNPEWAEDCVLVQLAVPSRRDVPEYQRLQRQVHELVGQICGRHSKLETGAPVIYLDASMSFLDLVALYQVADVALITSLRDGMNLVSYEFIACHRNSEVPGVLILSEFTGAAQSLGAGSIRVNPWNLQDTAQAIKDALEMSVEDRTALHRYAYQYVTEHTAQKWAETFLQSLQEACSDLMEVTAEVPPLLPYEELLTDWSDSTHRLIVIDLLECLVPAKRRLGMQDRRKKAASLDQGLRQCLQTIANYPNTTVVLTTDKSREALAQVAEGLPVILAAEGCAVYRTVDSREWIPVPEESDMTGLEEWMDGVQVVFDYFRERTPGSYCEKQAYQYRWHWDNAQFDFGSAQAREVLIHLWAGPLVNSEAEVVVGDRSIAVRPHACSRSQCLEKLLKEELGDDKIREVDFALCFAVVSHRDEDVYESLQNLLEGPDMEVEVDPEDTPSVAELDSVTFHVRETVVESPRSVSSACNGFSELHTPTELAPAIREGEPPPPYDWIPTAQREKDKLGEHAKESHHRPGDKDRDKVAGPLAAAEESLSSVAGHQQASSSRDSDTYHDDRPCNLYTLSLGMRKTKAQYALPHPYHVQNLIRAMAARLTQKQDDSASAS